MLGTFEYVVLQAVIHQRGEGYGMTIRREVASQTGRDVSIGAIYTTLSRLEAKGLISSRKGEPTPERGGRAKRYFRAEAAGIRASIDAKEIVTRSWAARATEAYS